MSEKAGADEFAVREEASRLARALRLKNQELLEENDRLRKRISLFETLESAKLRAPKWVIPKSASPFNGVAVLFITDVHWDEVISPDQIGWVNAYNREIAAQRIHRAFSRAIVVARDYLQVKFDGCVVLFGGDMLSGFIHDELSETNESRLPDSILSLLECLTSGLDLLRQEFLKLHVVGVVGNHSRLTKRPRAKFRAQDNLDWLLYKLLAREFRDKSGITFDFPNSADAFVTIYDRKYVLTHGDQFRGGSGIAGMLSPLLLGVHRKMKRQASVGQAYDVTVMGHWHQSLFYPNQGLIVGGSLRGYDEYSYLNNLSAEPAQVAFWVVTPRFGEQFHTDIVVQDRKEEGW